MTADILLSLATAAGAPALLVSDKLRADVGAGPFKVCSLIIVATIVIPCSFPF